MKDNNENMKDNNENRYITEYQFIQKGLDMQKDSQLLGLAYLFLAGIVLISFILLIEHFVH